MKWVKIGWAVAAIALAVALLLPASLPSPDKGADTTGSMGSSGGIVESGVAGLEAIGMVMGDWDSIAEYITEHASSATRYTIPYTMLPVLKATTQYTVVSEEASGSVPVYSGNFQVNGVLEADVAAFNGTHILVVVPGGLSLYKVNPPSNMSLVWNTSLRELVDRLVPNITLSMTVDGVNYSAILPVDARVMGVFLDEEGAVVVATITYWGVDFSLLKVAGRGASFNPYKTLVVLLDKGMNVSGYHLIDGFITDARLVNDTLSIVTTLPSYTYYNGSLEAIMPMVDEKVLDPGRVVVLEGEPSQYIIVSAVDRTGSSINSVALLAPPGGTLALLSRDGRLFLAANGLGSMVKLYSLMVAPDSIILTGSARLEGRIGSTWQVNPYKDYLLVLTEPYSGNGSVDLYVLNASTLSTVSNVTGLALNEEVYGVRVVGDILYLVTYRRVDPLYAINVSDPGDPAIIGFIKAPGVDYYLHPSRSGLIGVGRDEGGNIRVSLYRLVDNTLKTVSRVKLPFKNTPVFWRDGYKSILYVEERGLFLLPVLAHGVEEGKGYPTPTYMYAVVGLGNDSLTYTGLLKHPGATRAYAVGGVLYTVAPDTFHYGVIMLERVEPSPTMGPVIVAWSMDTLEPLGAIPPTVSSS